MVFHADFTVAACATHFKLCERHESTLVKDDCAKDNCAARILFLIESRHLADYKHQHHEVGQIIAIAAKINTGNFTHTHACLQTRDTDITLQL